MVCCTCANLCRTVSENRRPARALFPVVLRPHSPDLRNLMAQSAPAHILIVDDEAEVRRLLEAGLTAEGYAVSEAADGAGLLAVLDKKRVDLITLDVRLGGEDGFNLAREVRAKNNVPIIMISGKGDMIDRVVGLELGADDYIAKRGSDALTRSCRGQTKLAARLIISATTATLYLRDHQKRHFSARSDRRSTIEV